MLFYPSKNNNALNRRPFSPDQLTGRAMLNPHYRVLVDRDTRAICDSGAFQDDGVARPRLQPWAALQRQLTFEQWLSWQVTGTPDDWHFESIITYDQMFGVDEAMIDGKKVKTRGTIETAQPAVDETLRAAAYYASQRDRIQGRVCFAAQGINPDHYLNSCVVPMLDVMQDGDWFAFGGFCIIGKVPSLKPYFYETVERTLPLLKKRGVTRAHILGVCVADAIQFASAAGRRHGIEMSTDSSSIEVNSVMGRVFDGGRWQQRWSKAEKYIDYHPRDLAHANIETYSQWSSGL